MKLLISTTLLLSLCTSLQADLLLNYSFNTAADFQEFSTTYQDVGIGDYKLAPHTIDPGPLMAGGYTSPWDGNVLNLELWRDGRPPSFEAIETLEDAVTKNAYFSISYDVGSETSFSNLTFYAAGEAYNITLRSSLTGDENLAEALVDNTVGFGERELVTFDLSSVAELQNVTESVSFTFYMDTNGVNTKRQIYIDDLSVNGTAAVPEPSVTAVLMAAACACVVLLRRRMRR